MNVLLITAGTLSAIAAIMHLGVYPLHFNVQVSASRERVRYKA